MVLDKVYIFRTYSIVVFWVCTVLYAASQQQSALLCRLPKDDGFVCPFERALPMYYYDILKRECRQFLYHGCGGNGNRYLTLEQCQVGCFALSQCPKGEPLMDWAGNFQRCSHKMACPDDYQCVHSDLAPADTLCCPTLDSICHLPVVSGVHCGVQATSKFFFDSSARVCREFTYRGCGGNDNNFISKGQCLQMCADEVICLKGEPASEPGQPSVLYRCNDHSDCPPNHECIRRESKTYCCPSRKHICAQPLDKGGRCVEDRSALRWYFDQNQGLCKNYTFTGCLGNDNSFVTSEQCQEFCFGTCQGGAEMHLNEVTNQPQLCQPRMIDSNCPVGFQCSASSSPGIHMCCRAPPQCPKPESLLLFDDVADPLLFPLSTRTPRKCSIEDDECPEGFVCTEATNKEYVCCTRPVECPHGMTTLRDTVDKQPRRCTPGVPGNCPSPFGCVTAEGNSGYNVCCKPFQQCLMPYVSIATKEAIQCTPGLMQCPLTTHCLALKTSMNMHFRMRDIFEAAADAVPYLEPEKVEFDDPFQELQDARDIDYYCCYDMTHAYCTNGEPAFTDINKTQHRQCIQGHPLGCPPDMTCQRLVDGRYGCCRSPMAQQICTVAYVEPETWKPVMCSGITDMNCPNESVCKKAANQLYYCCTQFITGPYADSALWRLNHDHVHTETDDKTKDHHQ